MTPRAAPLTPDERRLAIIEACVPLLHQHGRKVTTKLIAEAAGVAEGTIFRVFDSKDDVIEEAIAHAMDTGPFLADLDRLQPGDGLRATLLDLTSLLQIRFRGIFLLMAAVGMFGPPHNKKHPPDLDTMREARAQASESMARHLAPYADELVLTPAEFVHRLRLLTFAGSHPHISDGHTLSPEEIVDTLLDGLRKERKH